MGDLSWSKALNAREDFKELDPTGPNKRAQKAFNEYCSEPNHETGDALLTALRGLPKQYQQYLKQALRI